MIRAFFSEKSGREAAYRLLARAVEDVYGVPCPEIEKDEHGKPRFPARPEIHFSLSHTAGLVLAVVGDRPCGCDAEPLARPVRPSVAARVCTREELAEFSFLELWTLKESFFKVRGTLPYPFYEARFSRAGGAVLTPDPLLHARLYPLGPWVAAVCAEGELPSEILPVPHI